MKLSKRLNNFPEYIFSRLAKKVVEVEKKTGKKVLNFGMGSPDFPPSSHYIRKLKELIDESGSYLYSSFGATLEFSNVLRQWYKGRFNVEIKENELYPLLGAKDGVSHLPLALLDEGDEVLIPDPGYPAFSGSVLMVGAVPIYYNLTEKNDFKIDIKELERKVTKRTRYIWVNFPSNPTGQVATLAELKKIVEFCLKHKIWLIYDNCYSEITFDKFIAPSILQIKGVKEVAVELNSFSKMSSLAGYRMGWIVGNAQIIAGLAKVKSQLDSGLSKPLQRLGAYILSNPDQVWHKKMIASYQKRRDIICMNLEKIGLKPVKSLGSLYLWIKIPDNYVDSEAFSNDLLEKKQILLTPGTAFGENGKRYVRVSICINIDNINLYF